jgi:hypothetical protein
MEKARRMGNIMDFFIKRLPFNRIVLNDVAKNMPFGRVISWQ